MEISIKYQIINEVERLNRLGFDSCAQAIRALLNDANFIQTWDLTDEPKLVGLVMIIKHLKIWA